MKRITLSLFLAVAAWLMPAGAEAKDPNLRPIYAAKTDQLEVALTFDISWGQEMGPKVLDVLKEHDVKATFFLSGPWSRTHPELVQRIVADGHQIQSHGHKHVNFSGLGAQGVIDNLRQAHRILTELTGQTPTLVRPPNGDFNETSVKAALETGYKTVIWSVDSLDWKNPGVTTITNRVLKKVHPGAIILLHASDSCKQTDQALPAIITGLRAQGYQFRTMTELLEHGVDPNGKIH